MKSIKLKPGDEYKYDIGSESEFFVTSLTTNVLIGEIVYGYFCEERNIYLLHNINGPALISGSEELYVLDGFLYDKKVWNKKIRKYKIKKLIDNE